MENKLFKKVLFWTGLVFLLICLTALVYSGRQKSENAVSVGSVEYDKQAFSCAFVRDLGKVLEAPATTPAHALEVNLERINGSIRARIWTRRGVKELTINSLINRESDVKPIDIKISGEMPTDGGTEFIKNDIVIMTRASREGESGSKTLQVNNAGQRFKLPFGDFRLMDGASARNYRFSARVKATESYLPVSIIVIDFKEEKIVCEIPIPPDIKMQNLWFVLSKDADALVAVETHLKWAVVLDLLAKAPGQ